MWAHCPLNLSTRVLLVGRQCGLNAARTMSRSVYVCKPLQVAGRRRHTALRQSALSISYQYRHALASELRFYRLLAPRGPPIKTLYALLPLLKRRGIDTVSSTSKRVRSCLDFLISLLSAIYDLCSLFLGLAQYKFYSLLIHVLNPHGIESVQGELQFLHNFWDLPIALELHPSHILCQLDFSRQRQNRD
jgi:hypothetical protein